MVRMRYGESIRQYAFRKGDIEPKQFEIPSIIDRETGKMRWPVGYDFIIYFNKPFGGISSVSAGERQTELDDIYLDLDSVYGRYHFVIAAAKTFNWHWYQSVLVTVRCRHMLLPDSSVSKSFQISPASPTVDYSVTLPQPDLYLFEVTKEYSSEVNSPHYPAVLTEPTSQDISLFSTLYHQRMLTLHANMDWQDIEEVIVSASYACSATDSNSSLQQTFKFTESDAAAQHFSADQTDPAWLPVNLEIFVAWHQDKSEGKSSFVQTTTVLNSIDIAHLI